MNRTTAAVLRYLAAAALLVSGLVHLQLYLDGYRDFPDENLGRSFLLQVVLAVVLAIAVVVWRSAWVRLAGIVVSAGTLVAFVMSRTGDGIFGLREEGLEPSPQAVIALIAEIAAIVLLVLLLVLDRARAGQAEPTPAALAIGAAIIVLTVGLGVLWNQDGDDAVAADASPTTVAGRGDGGAGGRTVTIAEFQFNPPELTVPAGTEVTWINNDGVSHSVVAEDGSFESDTLGSGGEFRATLTTPGTYAYLCGIHSSMRGTIVVT